MVSRRDVMGYNVTRRKSEIRICEKLPNDKLLNLYFYRKRDDPLFTRWYVGLCISDTRKEANYWFTKHRRAKKAKITGDGSITGLRLALKYILEVANNLGFHEELIIQWEDDRRMSAYRYLKRYGFTDYFDENEKLVGYGIRNPKYWELNEHS